MVHHPNKLLNVGLVLFAIGFVLFLNFFHNEPLWVEWLLGPVLMYLGLPMAMVGVAIHFFGTARNCEPPAHTSSHH